MRRAAIICTIAMATALAGCGDSSDDDTTAPTVTSTTPADGDTNVAPHTAISVTFSEPMHAGTVQANYQDTQCTGSVQVSADGFATCVRFSGGDGSNENKTYTFFPMIDLLTGTYQIKVTTGAEDPSGNGLASEFVTPTGFTTVM